MTYFIKVCVFFVFIYLIACSPAEDKQEHREYYNTTDFIKKQIDILSRKDIKVKKTILKGKNKQVKELTVKDWQKELYFFLQANLNNPSLAGEYIISQAEEKDLKKLTYKASKDKFKVKILELWIDKNRQKPKKMKAVLKNDNFVYSSDLVIFLECEDRNHTWHIVNYGIKSEQQIIFGNKEVYEVNVEVINH